MLRRTISTDPTAGRFAVSRNRIRGDPYETQSTYTDIKPDDRRHTSMLVAVYVFYCARAVGRAIGKILKRRS